MREQEFTISELISEFKDKTTFDLNKRTIRFYVKEKMISAPSHLGGGAKYGEEHLLRLLLIHEFQKSRMKLSEIREKLDAMSIDEKRGLVHQLPSKTPVLDRHALESWLGNEGLINETPRRKVDVPEKRWVRFSVDDGIEVHVDEETFRKSRSKIKQWLDDFNKTEKGGKS